MYEFHDDGLYANGFIRVRELSQLLLTQDRAAARVEIQGTGLGLGVGWKGELARLEVGVLQDDFAASSLAIASQVEPDQRFSYAGGYAHVAVDLYRWQHFLLQANSQVEMLRLRRDSYGYDSLPSRQYVASAGLSVHATEINSVIPSAVVITAVLFATCLKGGCGTGSWGSWPSYPRCRDGKDRDCKKER